MNFTGAVLVGGASRRYGSDKALAVVDGEPMAHRIARQLEVAGAREVVFVGGADRIAGFSHWADDFPGEGPLGGLLTVFRRAVDPVVVVVACDLPDLDASTISAVVAGLTTGVDVAVARTDRREVLCAAWDRLGAGPACSQAFAAGERSLQRLLVGLRVHDVPMSADRFRNINTLGDHLTSVVMDVREVSVHELAGVVSEAFVIDVREIDEYEEVRVPGVVLIPLGEVAERIDEIPVDVDVYMLCRSGGRSMRAAQFLAQHGRSPINVAGGTLGWIDAGYDVESGPVDS